jgi:hypothetical protein
MKTLPSLERKKLILEMLNAAETDRDEYKTYVSKYHVAELRNFI